MSTPNKFGQVDSYVTPADNFGGQTEVFNGVDVNANARIGSVVRSGGLSTGKVTQDTCAIVKTPMSVTRGHDDSARCRAPDCAMSRRRSSHRPSCSPFTTCRSRCGHCGDAPEPPRSADHGQLHRDQRGDLVRPLGRP